MAACCTRSLRQHASWTRRASKPAGRVNICANGPDMCAGLWPGDKAIARRVLWALAGPLASQQAARDLQEASSHEQALQALSRSRDGLSQLGKLCSFVFEPASRAQVGALRCPPMLSHQKLGVRDAASTRALQWPRLSLCTDVGPCQVAIQACPAEGTHLHAGACLAATCAAPLAESQTHPGVPGPEVWGVWQEARQKLMKLSHLVRATDEVAGGGYTALADMAFLYASTRHWFLFSGGYQVASHLLAALAKSRNARVKNARCWRASVVGCQAAP